MKIAIGADHRGFKYKELVKKYLQDIKYDVTDFGTDSEESVDYPLFAVRVARSVAEGKCERGIVVCGSGIGVCISANKVKGIRSAIAYDSKIAEMCRRHNNVNVLSLSSDFTSEEEIYECVKTFLNTEFEGGRHERRLEEITDLTGL
ncbi:ribose 5-phosphate isomerase B [soil metagenome]